MFVRITDDDVPGIVKLMNRAYRGTQGTPSWNLEARYLSGDRITDDLLRRELFSKPNAVFLKWVAPPSDDMLGCLCLEPEDDGGWYLGSLAADPERQRNGLGSKLLSAAEDWVRQHDGVRVRMTVVNVRDTLIAWYLRRGYGLTGETEPFPYGDDRFGKPLRDDLHFVVLQKSL